MTGVTKQSAGESDGPNATSGKNPNCTVPSDGPPGASRAPNLAYGLDLGQESVAGYLIESPCLSLFMLPACSWTVLLQHPASVVRQMFTNAFFRRLLTGTAMGLTAIALIYLPRRKQSDAHLNPSVTLTFLRLGKITPWDAGFYVV